MLHAVAHGLRLQKLGGVQQGVKIIRIQEGLLHVVHDLSIRGLIALMLFHHIGENIPVLRQGEGLHRFQRGEGLEAKFRHIPEKEFPVFRDGLVPMPHIPIMHISPVLIVRHIKAAAGGWARRPVEGLRIILLQDLRNDVFIHFDIIGKLAVL